MSDSPAPKKFSILPKIINGGIAGIIGVSCVFPLDLVKTRLQNQQIGPNGEKMYKNMFDCFRKTYRAEGYFGMYRGSAVNILLITPEKAIKLAANDYFRYHLMKKDGTLPMPNQVAAGGLAGLFQIIVTTPMEFLKIQMQDAGRVASKALAEGKTVIKTSARTIAFRLIKEKGIFGLYKGVYATGMRDVTFSCIYFPMFAELNALGPRRNDGTGEAVFWCSFLSGLASGSTCAFLVTPLDVVKTRLQAIKKAEGEKEFKGFIDCIVFDCFRKTYRAEGYFGMYRGSAVNILLITPEKAIKLAANDYFRHNLTKKDGTLPMTHQMAAGGLAGAFQIIVTTPMELLKIQMQDAGRVAAQAIAEGKTVVKTSATTLAAGLIKEKGIFGLYKGIGATGLRDILFSVIYFPLFAELNALGPRKADGSGEAVFWCSFISGLAAGSTAALVVNPFDVVKTRLQAIKKAEGEKEFKGIVDCITKTMRYEGPTAFFKGGLCRVIVIAPLFGIAQTVYYLGVAEKLLGQK